MTDVEYARAISRRLSKAVGAHRVVKLELDARTAEITASAVVDELPVLAVGMTVSEALGILKMRLGHVLQSRVQEALRERDEACVGFDRRIAERIDQQRLWEGT